MEKDLNADYSISNKCLDAEYPSSYRKFLLESVLVQLKFTVECLQKIYHSGRLKGTRLLDFGCGPTIHMIASASLHFNDIVLSEWSETNRAEVEKWLREDEDALDWTPLLEMCARAEGFSDLNKGVATIERRIRKTVKKVIPCDALPKDILPEGLGEFDVISTSYTLECSCFTIEKFKGAIKKLTKYLKNGGALLMTTAIRGEDYQVYETIPAFSVTEENVNDTLIEAGLEPRDLFKWKDTEKYSTFKYGGVLMCYAVKM